MVDRNGAEGKPASLIAAAKIANPRLARQIERQIGGQVQDFVARVGEDAARRQVERELRRARLARSRQLYRAWSAVLQDIDGSASAKDDGEQRQLGARPIPKA